MASDPCGCGCACRHANTNMNRTRVQKRRRATGIPRQQFLLPCELVGAREPAVAVFHGTGVGPLVHRRLAGTVRVLPRLHGHQLERHRRLLVHLRQDLVALARRGVVLGQLHRVVASAAAAAALARRRLLHHFAEGRRHPRARRRRGFLLRDEA